MQQTFKYYLIESAYIQKIANKINLPVKDLKHMSDKEVETILADVGKHDFAPDSEFDAEQLTMGIAVEKEHTSSTLIAKLIAKDHLKEDPKYYTKLKKMEAGK